MGGLLAAACADEIPDAPPPSAVDVAAEHETEAAEQSAQSRTADHSVARALDQQRDELCDGLPAQLITVTPQSFVEDEELVRVLIAPSNRCESLLVVAPKHTPAADSACALIDFRGDQHPLPIGVLREGECDWLDVQPSGALGSGPAAAPGCTGIDELSLTVNAENFNERGRVDLVAFVPQTRCYVFISAVQQPDRVEPFQFGPGEACVIRHSQSPQGDCSAIAFWTGRGRGGVSTQLEAEAAVALIRLESREAPR